tara:strand:+ start:2664 stop:3578 length:915 start_codon:yes stop_codon:yes gene_type:complete
MTSNITNKILNIGLFWQYPVITEKKFYEQNKEDDRYLGLPWATIIDKNLNLQKIYEIVINDLNRKGYFTCCQHIHFRKLIPLFKELKIKILYSSHKIKGEDNIDGIMILPCPLYAVNLEDESRNEIFKGKDFMNIKRNTLYSFVGAYNTSWYISNIRKRIYDVRHPINCKIEKTNNWHFENVVYSSRQNSKGELNEDDIQKAKTNKYNEIMLDSRYTLCPSGSGPNSIRFWEALGVGSIPILLADTLELPKDKLWKDSILIVEEKDLKKIPKILKDISIEKEKDMRKNCLKLYKYFKDNYRNKI